MSLLTSPGPIVRDSLGSVTQLVIPVTTLTNIDTYNVGTSLQFVSADFEGTSTTGGSPNSGDVSYSVTTGLLTIVTTNQGTGNIVLQIRG